MRNPSIEITYKAWPNGKATASLTVRYDDKEKSVDFQTPAVGEVSALDLSSAMSVMARSIQFDWEDAHPVEAV